MKKYLLPVLGVTTAMLMACSDDSSSSPSNAVDPGIASSASVDPGLPAVSSDANSGLVLSSESSAPVVDPGASTYYAVFPTPNQLAVQTMYNNWIAKFYVTYEEEVPASEEPYLGAMVEKLKGSARIKFDSPLNTVSEGIGYGMLITYFMKDWEKFNRLFKYYQAYPVSAADGLFFMKWMVKGDEFKGGFSADATGGSATDADLDVMTALFLAYGETGNVEYLNYAKGIAGAIYSTEVNPTTHLFMPGNDGLHMNDGYVYNTSYFSLVGIRLAIKYDTERSAAWQQVLDATYAYMLKVQAAGNGLWPDWSNADGIPTNPENNSSTGKLCDYFGLEGVRIPLRIMWDYNWFGDDRAKTLAETAGNFAFASTGGDISKTLIKYIYQGEQPKAGQGGAHFRGAFCSLWTVNATLSAYTPACNELIVNTPFKTTNSLYFEPSMQLLYSLFLNGYFIKYWNY
ncbi:MAG: glycosyl hydrolase family 8 [Fibrobacter sp.]|uniref:glycosyl hydrolase family 8 n=1 Tax=Fibrobacter sp. TaxID=35828 RepID=UPI002A91F52D|nr:glycosyl hydrolase family 8 [Fibrobacter sp.]MDY6264417.1 glycosyl hydrolase family 8 [Fibrobacter sp.]MDY6385994.1 glycosyl hydrolase family 8 [Fibrobacter sp.]